MSEYTAEIKVTRHYEAKTDKDRYGTVLASEPSRDERIGHITLVADNMIDLRARIAAVLEQVTG